jgi:outer membrane protein OmpA-like peptidoglycan-associated protein
MNISLGNIDFLNLKSSLKLQTSTGLYKKMTKVPFSIRKVFLFYHQTFTAMRSLLIRLIILLSPLLSFSQMKESFSVYFGFDKYVLTKKALTPLDSFCRENKNSISHPEIEIKGYCDNKGSANYNFILSDKRVATVKKILLKKGMNIEFIISASGYGETEPLNENKTEEERQLNRRVDISIINSSDRIRNGKTISLKQKIADSTTITGTNIILHNINFEGGLHQFLPESEPMLKELTEAMQSNPKLVIRVEGHICCQSEKGDGPDNETGIDNLSEARAKAVMDYLLANGIDAKRVSYKGFGHSFPIYPFPEQTEEERIQNRRVEIKIISK